MSIITWWNNNWTKRVRISSDSGGNAYTSGVHYLVQRVNLRSLIDAGKVRPDGNDVRIVYQPEDGSAQEVMRYVASGDVCKSKIYFPIQNTIDSGTDIGDQAEYVYYLYYGNPNATSNYPTWVNVNFPQAPYSPVVEPIGGAYSGYADKFLVRCTESGTNITDYDGNFSPISNGAGLLFWEHGRLDRSIYIPNTDAHYLKVPYNAAHQKSNPSGAWHMDIWFKPAALDGFERRLISRYDGATTQTEMYYVGSAGAKLAGAERGVTTSLSHVWVADKWYFVRAMGYSNGPDNINLYILASGVSATVSNTTSTAPAVDSSSDVYIGLLNGGGQYYTPRGHVEQARYGGFLANLAPNGIQNAWLPPDFVDPEYNLSLGAEENPPEIITGYLGGFVDAAVGSFIAYLGGYVEGGGTHVTGHLGGYVLTNSENYVTGLLGGYFKAEPGVGVQGILGGYATSLNLTPGNGILGGIASGLHDKIGYLGAYALGMPNYVQYAETHARALSKASSENAVDQGLDIDAELVLKALGADDFNSKLILYRRNFAEFYAKLKVQKHRSAPSIVITSVTPSSGVLIDGARQVAVVASGTLGDASEFISASIDFGVPTAYMHSISGFSTAGPIWTASHDYTASGVYIITARAIDNMGMTATDVYVLNLASGLNPGVDYPYIRITGTPRVGTVPPVLQISFTTEASGVVTSLGTYSNENLYWDFGNRETSHKINPKTYYHSPGWYAPTARFRYVNLNGTSIWTGDTLLLGWNR